MIGLYHAYPEKVTIKLSNAIIRVTLKECRIELFPNWQKSKFIIVCDTLLIEIVFAYRNCLCL